MNFLSLIYPERCPFCNRMLTKKYEQENGYCTQCATLSFFRTNMNLQSPEVLSFLLELFCPLVYTGTAKDALIRYKFQGENWMYKAFAKILHRYLVAGNGYTYCDYITCVPVSEYRYRVRGYNQTELLAKEIARLSGIPFKEFLLRKDEQGSIQTGKLNRENRLSLTRFQINSSCDFLKNAGLLLVDDILTTGSTAAECGRILLTHGAGFVKLVVLASGRRDLGGVCA